MRRILTLTCTAMMVAGSLSACDTGTEDTPVADFARKIRDATAARASARFQKGFTETVGGVFRYSDGTARMDFQVSIKGDDGADYDFILTGDVYYAKIPPARYGTGEHPVAGKPWLKYSSDSFDPKRPGTSGPSLGAYEPGQVRAILDPNHLIERVKDARAVNVVGAETIDGVHTTHYSIPLDIPDATQRNGWVCVGGVYPLDVWLADDATPVQIVDKVPSQPFVKSCEIRPVVNTYSYRDWGQPVHIEAPPADQVVPS
jgi:hypothetical protein